MRDLLILQMGYYRVQGASAVYFSDALNNFYKMSIPDQIYVYWETFSECDRLVQIPLIPRDPKTGLLILSWQCGDLIATLRALGQGYGPCADLMSLP